MGKTRTSRSRIEGYCLVIALYGDREGGLDPPDVGDTGGAGDESRGPPQADVAVEAYEVSLLAVL